jgi:hypothetical protein
MDGEAIESFEEKMKMNRLREIGSAAHLTKYAGGHYRGAFEG